MDKIPIEILQDIFHLSLSDGVGGGDLSLFFTGPLFISHVCRYWRQVAISFGILWTHLEVRPNLPRIKYDMVHTWIERTNGLPLEFDIEYALEDDKDVEQRRTMESVTKLLLAEQHRWRFACFSWRFMAFSPEFTRIDITSMPMLHSMFLKINIRKCDGGERILPSVSLARSRSIEQVSFESECDIDYGSEPLQYLTNGRRYFRDWMDARAAESCLEELRACPNLKRLHAYYYVGGVLQDDNREMPENRPHLVHNIKHLVLDDTGGYNFPELVIDKVTLPNLRSLVFKACSSLETGSALLGLFQRCNPPLEKLDLFGSCAGYQNLIPALRHLPSLQTLTIECCQDPELIFEGLSSSVDNGIICPELLCLQLPAYGSPDNVPEPREALDALCSMVELREDPGSPGRIRINGDFVIPTSHMRREFEVILGLLSMQEYNYLCITFKDLDELSLLYAQATS